MISKKNTSKHVDVDKKVSKDDLAQTLAAELNKSTKDSGKVAYFLSEQEDPSAITDWISTG